MTRGAVRVVRESHRGAWRTTRDDRPPDAGARRVEAHGSRVRSSRSPPALGASPSSARRARACSRGSRTGSGAWRVRLPGSRATPRRARSASPRSRDRPGESIVNTGPPRMGACPPRVRAGHRRTDASRARDELAPACAAIGTPFASRRRRPAVGRVARRSGSRSPWPSGARPPGGAGGWEESGYESSRTEETGHGGARA